MIIILRMATITKKQFIYVNSRNRLSGTDSNFSYKFDIDPNSDFDRAVVLQASIPKSYYLVEDGYNTFTLKEDTDEAIVTVTPGWYNRKSFQIVLSTLLTAASPNTWQYVVSFPNAQSAADTGKYKFVVSGATTQPQFIFTTFLFEAMGFDSDTTNNFVGGELYSTNVIKLQPEDTIFIHSDLVANQTDNVLQEIFTNGDPSYSSVNFLNPSFEAYAKKITASNSGSYNFYLTDEDGLPINLNGQNFNMTLLLYKENDVYRMIKGMIKYFLAKDTNENEIQNE